MNQNVVYYPADPEAVDWALPDEIARVCDADDYLVARPRPPRRLGCTGRAVSRHHNARPTDAAPYLTEGMNP